MPIETRVTIRGKTVRVLGSGSKSDIARALLDQGYTVSEISKAVPMAYSQAHSIAKSEAGQQRMKAAGAKLRELQSSPAGKANAAAIRDLRERHKAYNKANNIPDPVIARPETRASARAAEAKAHRTLARVAAGKMPKPRPGVGKLRTPGHPTDVLAGECANCGFDLAVRRGPVGFHLVHVNITAEEYLNTAQFCQAVPRRLL